MQTPAPIEETKENKTHEIDHDLIPDNTFTMILKSKGKVYALGGVIGEISPDIPDEDLDSVLRAIQGAGVSLQRTLAMEVAGRDEAYALPNDTVEQNLAPPPSKEA